MQEKNADLFLNVIKSLDKAGALKELVLIGSWCLLFYKELFKNSPLIPAVRTMDMDLLVLKPKKKMEPVNVHKILESLDFEAKYHYSTGYCKYRHKEFTVEFLMPLKGKGDVGVEEIKSLSINAQGLRYLDFSDKDLMELSYKGLTVRLPRPEIYTLLKFIVHEERKNPEKKDKDLQTAKQLGLYLIGHENHKKSLQATFSSMHKNMQKKLLRITSENALEINEVLKAS